MVRNTRIFGELVPLDTHGGLALYAGQLFRRGLPVEEVFRRVGYSHQDIEKGQIPGGPRGQLEADRRAGEAAGRLIREDPGGFLRAIGGNVAELWLGMDFHDVAAKGGRLGVMVLLGIASYVPLVALGLAALVKMVRLRKWETLGAMAGILLLTTAVHAVVQGGKRYRVGTIDPVLIILAAYQVSGWIRAFGSRASAVEDVLRPEGS